MQRKQFIATNDIFLYVHVPFCFRACPYCNFNFRLIQNYHATFIQAYFSALLLEWQLFLRDCPELKKIKTLYFGGGTPSLVDPESLAILIKGLSPFLHAGTEVTLEANPEDLVAEKGIEQLRAWKQLGVNRLSLGGQSFQEKRLRFLGRGHQGAEIEEAVALARENQFENISMDAIGFLPSETWEDLRVDLEKMTACEPKHVSFYGLTFEENTVFYSKKKAGLLQDLPEDVAAEHYESMVKFLKEHQFEHYEISNFAKAGFRSRHNQCYWTYQPYLGLGAGAHSFFHKRGQHFRSMNLKSPEAYVASLEKGEAPIAESELVEGKSAMAEFIFTSLRKIEGMVLEDFEPIFGCPLLTVYGPKIESLIRAGLLEIKNAEKVQVLRLTPKGVLVSDHVFSEFV